MKAICDRGALLDAVNLVSNVVASRTPKPQLTCVLVRAQKSGDVGLLSLAGTDAEIALTLRTERVDVSQAGAALIPADKLRQIVAAEEGETTLAIEASGEQCQIRGRDARFTLHGYPPSDFPALPEFDKIAGGSCRIVLTIKGDALGQMIARTLFATARENSRYAINGVLLYQSGKRLEMVATDGRRLALARGTTGVKDAPQASCIIPTKALGMVQKLIRPDDEVVIAVTEAQAHFAIGGRKDPRAVLSSNLVEGTFPPYEEVIPKDQDVAVTFDREVFLSAVKRAALLTNEESRGVRMAFSGKDKRVEFTSRAPEMGEARIEAQLASYSGGDVEVGFNPTFLSDALKVINDSSVIFELKASGKSGPTSKPGVVRSGDDFLYVVMPVNLG